MAYVGFGDLKDVGILPLWDLSSIKKLELADGTTFDQVVLEASAVAFEASAEITRLPIFRTLFSIQNGVTLKYGTYTGGGIQEATEYSVPDPYRGKTTGHSLPIKLFERSVGWTRMMLEKVAMDQIEADLTVMVNDIQDHSQVKMLTRLFATGAETVGDTAGASVPFADGGTADATWIPKRGPWGEVFANTHNHYLRHATLDVATSIQLAFDHLWEHGHRPPFTLIGSSADAATYQALTEWRRPSWDQWIIYRDASAATDKAKLNADDLNTWDGLLELPKGIVQVHLSPRVPTAYYNMHKAYGVGDARNPLRMRIDPKRGFGWQNVPGIYVNDPTTLAAFINEFGWGIGEDRTNTVNVEIDSAGNYASPTIS